MILMMKQNYYHICVPNENTVKVKKSNANLTRPEQVSGKFNGNKITSKIQDIFKNPANLKDEQIQKVGEVLFEALFDSELRKDFLDFYQEVVRTQKQILQIILEINEIALPEVVAYPWELICLPQKYNEGDIHFATDRKLSFFRCKYQLEEALKLPIKLNKREQLKIALVVSRPTTDSQLSNVEYQGVQQYLRILDRQQDKVKFLPVMDSLNLYEIVQRLEEDKPDIFHFIGHGKLREENGTDVGEIAFVNDAGEADWKDAKVFSQLFSGHTPKIVILQACETGKQSETNAFSSVAFRLMLQGIPVVVAMQYKVSNQTASSFVKEFYSQIIKGNSVDIAVQKARFKLAIENGYEKRDFAIPVIYMNALDGYLCSPQKDKVIDITSTNSRLKSLQNQKEKIESQIAELEELQNRCNQEIEGTTNADTRRQLRARIRNYSTEIDELYDEIDNIGKQIKNTLKL
jgi:CHAT domain-containing protein